MAVEKLSGVLKDGKEIVMKKKVLSAGLAIILIAVLSFLAIDNFLFSRPLGPSLKDEFATHPALSRENFASLENQLGEAGLQPDEPRSPESLQESGQQESLSFSERFQSSWQSILGPRPVCGSTSVLTILFVGTDGGDYLYGLADVIRIVRVDFVKAEVSFFTLDRAIWVEIPGISDHYGITHGLLNQAYFYGVPAMGYYDDRAGGAGLLAKTLKWNFDLDVDNYAVVNLYSFVRIVDTLGGIEVDLPDPVQGGLPAGRHRLNGEQALELARNRQYTSTLGRSRNQNEIIRGLANKALSPQVLGKAPELIDIFGDTVLTDLSSKQIADIACLAGKMESGDLRFFEIPDSYYVPVLVYSE